MTVAAESPVRSLPPVAWARKNLFSTWYNALFTVVFGLLLAFVFFRAARYVLITGRWDVISANLTSFMVGLFPRDNLPQLWVAMAIWLTGAGLFFGATASARVEEGYEIEPLTARGLLVRGWPIGVFLVVVLTLSSGLLPVVLVLGVLALSLLGRLAGERLPKGFIRWRIAGLLVFLLGGFVIATGFGEVGWEEWGGLLLTMFFATATIVISFPIGVVLALGRRSKLPIIKWLSVGYIELIRGVPLITLLFMGFFVIGFFLPSGFSTPSVITRALIAMVLFTAAYIAEVVRGGLQGIPRGQIEAAQALGLSPVKMMRLVVLPQALRNVIPALVGQFISLFKDTSLVVIIGLLDLLRVSEVVLVQERFRFQGLQPETLAFAAFVYWVFAYTMSRESQRIEKRLGVGER